jgi:UDP-N-acetylmuramoylalanine--D-glutamate ligase
LGAVLILGLGKSGQAAASYCLSLTSEKVDSVTVMDSGDSAILRERAEALAAAGAAVVLGVPQVEGRFDLCVASPGIPPHAPLLSSARLVCGEVISEIEFAFRESHSPWVAVTGTNGKTTTTALITHLLNCGGIPARSVGNFGPPAIEAVMDAADGEVLVAEVSSFQLALTDRFHPRVAVLLNITPDHVEWHGSLESYAADKGRVFANLGDDDVAVVDVDDEGSALQVPELVERRVPIVRVSRFRSFEGGASVVDGMMRLQPAGAPVDLIPIESLGILGSHNVSNALAAAAAADAMGVSAGALRDGLSSFEPIEHRLEPAGSVAGVEWFNDSKATNPDAVSKAMEAFSGRPLILLLGGRSKGSDFGPLATQAAGIARTVIVFGEARDEIVGAFSGMDISPESCATLAQAVGLADGLARPGDAVLLSPGCASFDEFENYEERGRAFKSMVAALSQKGQW